MPEVTLLRSDGPPRIVRVRAGATLLHAALRARLPLARSCRAQAICGDCRVRLVGGADQVDPPGPAEAALAARLPLAPEERYACLARLHGPVTFTARYW